MSKAKCPKCGTLLELSNLAAGTRVGCPSCGASLAVPGPAPAPAAPGHAAPPPLPAAGPPLAASPASSRPLARYLPFVIGGGAAALVFFVGLLLVAFTLKGSPAAWDYLPHDSKMVMVLNVPAILKSDLFGQSIRTSDKFQQMEKEMLDETGMTLDDISQISMGMSDIGLSGSQRGVFVVQFSRDFDRGRMLQRSEKQQRGWKEETIGKATVHVGRNLALCFPDDRTIVGGDPPAVRSALDPARHAGLNPAMKELAASLGASRCLALAMVTPSDLSALPPGAPVPPDMIQKVQGVTVQADLASDLRVEAAVFCKDAETAESLRKMADGFLELGKQNTGIPAEVKDVINAVQVKASGPRVSASVSVPQKTIDQFTKDGGMRIPLPRD